MLIDTGSNHGLGLPPGGRAIDRLASRSLGLSLQADASGWRVVGAISGSPAEEAGIATGDVVTKIEGEPASGWTKDRIDGWTDTHDKVALSIARTDQSRELVLPVWELVP